MQIPKPTDADREFFGAVLPDDPRVVTRPMFGNLGAFVNGNMFAGLFGSDLGVRLADADRERLEAEGGGPFGPAERPMGGYTTLPASVRAAPGAAASWVQRAFDHISAMPPKAVKQAKPAKQVKQVKQVKPAKPAKA